MMILTRGELRRREEAVVAGFVERNGDKAYHQEGSGCKPRVA